MNKFNIEQFNNRLEFMPLHERLSVELKAVEDWMESIKEGVFTPPASQSLRETSLLEEMYRALEDVKGILEARIQESLYARDRGV